MIGRRNGRAALSAATVLLAGLCGCRRPASARAPTHVGTEAVPPEEKAIPAGGEAAVQPAPATRVEPKEARDLLEEQRRVWTSIGIGGGGGFFWPSGSPHDPNLVFVSSDMGGFYRSEDAGKSWRMIDWRQMPHCRSPVFHPADPDVVYAYGYGGSKFKVSRDRGWSWENVGRERLWKGDTLLSLTIDRGNPELMLLSGAKALYRSTDGGGSWSRVKGAPTGFLGMHVEQTSPAEKRVVLAANKDAAYSSDNGGLAWSEKSNGLPWRGIRSFCGGSDPATGRAVVYCTIPSRKEGDRFAGGGVYRSTDGGETWEWAMGEGINKEIGKHPYGASDIDQYQFLGQAETVPGTVYVTNLGTGYDPPYHYTVYRSDDAGEHWRDCFFNDPRFKENNTEVGWLTYDRSRGYGDDALGFAVNAGSPDQLFYTNDGEVFMSMNGGKSWYQAFSRHAEGQGPPGTGHRWASIGLEDTSCWRYVFDPHDRNRTYICYTDIGFARSEDRGRTWHSVRLTNTVYQLACDPDVPGLLFAACSSQHDIPHWGYIQGPVSNGKLVRSTDYGKSWTPVMNGFPGQPTPCTAIVIDPESPKDSRTLYAGVYGHGVFKSTDGGGSWTNKSEGIVPEQNRQVYSVLRWKDGTLFCAVAGRRKGRGVERDLTGGLYVSTDGTETWTKISSDDMFRTVDFAVDPDDRNVIYVAAMDGLAHKGGVYKTTDGGRNWKLSVPEYDRELCGYIEGFSVRLHPENPDVVFFLTNTHGMFLSYDAGESWSELRPPKCPPFMNCQRIYWDPEDKETVYIVTFGGGVWRGPDPAAPVPPARKRAAREPLPPPVKEAAAGRGRLLVSMNFDDLSIPDSFREGREALEVEREITAGGSPGALRVKARGAYVQAESYAPFVVGPDTVLAVSYYCHNVAGPKVQLNTSRGSVHFYGPEHPAQDEWAKLRFKLSSDAKVKLEPGDKVRSIVFVAQAKAKDAFLIVDEVVVLPHPSEGETE